MAPSTRAFSSAWNEPAGHGLFIADYTFTGGARYFNGAGALSPAAAYTKSEAVGYVEYGLTDSLMAVLKPEAQWISLARPSGTSGPAPASRYAGIGTGEAAAQWQVLAYGPAALALQTGFRLPPTTSEANPALVGNTSRDIDLRALGGLSFSVGGWPAFLDAQTSYRWRSGGAPAEWHADMTAGLRPWPRLLLLLQSTTTGSIGPGTPWFPASRSSKVAGSVVFDLTRRWSVEIGLFETLAGIAALRERGALATVWYRF